MLAAPKPVDVQAASQVARQTDRLKPQTNQQSKGTTGRGTPIIIIYFWKNTSNSTKFDDNLGNRKSRVLLPDFVCALNYPVSLPAALQHG